MTPDTPSPRTAATAAHAAIAHARQRLRDARRAFLDHGDADSLHDLRVALRRLRGTLRLYRDVADLPRRLDDRALRRLGRRFTRLRDLDIVLGALDGERDTARDRDAESLALLVAHLADARLRAASAAKYELRRPRTRRLLRALKRWERAPDFLVEPDAPASAVLPDVVRSVADELAVHPGWDVLPALDGAGRFRDPDGAREPEQLERSLHALRRAAKRTRYVLEAASAGLGRDESDAIAFLQEVQDVLGELQDARVIEAYLASCAPEERPFALEVRLRHRRRAAIRRWRETRRRRAAPVVAAAALS
jgi:CHAD domain-containing protein